MKWLTERRRERVCPSCGGGNVMRGPKVGGLAIPLAHTDTGGNPATTAAYANVCYDCGMVVLFVRLSETVKPVAVEVGAVQAAEAGTNEQAGEDRSEV